MKYLNKFEDQAAYEAWKGGDKFIKPSLNMTSDNNVLYDYDPNFRARYLLENMDDLSTNLTQCGNIFESFKVNEKEFSEGNVTEMSYMFASCSGLTSLDLSNFNTSNVTDMSHMFNSCKSLTSITFGSQADVSKVSSYVYMFYTITTTGRLIYPSAYESAWNNIIVTKQSSTKFPSTWTKQVI